MIAIDNKLISDEVVEARFVCDLNKCKGSCCEDGDAGAPLEKWELDKLNEYYPVIEKYMSDEGKKEVKRQGKYVYDREFGFVTPTINGGLCAYGCKDEFGIIKCSIEQAFSEGKTDWKKPVSCHLFPIKITQSEEDPDMEYLNYVPRQDLCKPACALGKKLKIPVYQFLKEALIRKYGQEFYNTLAATAEQINLVK